MAKPKLRFPEFTDEWEEHKFGNDIIEHTEKTSDKETYPLYSLTIEEGVIPKSERYEREFLINKEGDVYKIVPPSAFVYNPMNLRFGALKVNHEKFAVSVSGYYNIFSLRNPETLQFWENYLTTDKMLNFYFSIATGSLIEKLRVHFSQFVNIKKPLPSIEEQKKISKFLLSIDDAIQMQEKELAALEEQKKGIMQKLFNREVRFKRDDGSEYPEWEERTFDEIFNVIQNNTFSRDRLNDEGEVLNIHYGDVLIKYGAFIDVSKEEVPHINDDIQLNKFDEKSFLRNGDIIIADTAEDMTVGKATEICGAIDKKILSGLHTIPCRPKVTFVSKYLGYYINSEKYHNQLIPLIQGIKVSSISKSNISKTLIIYPCAEEQKKIADCVLAYDEAIQIKKDKLEIWKEIKKGLLQQMFV